MPAYPDRVVQPNLFAFLEIFNAQNSAWDFWGLIFGAECFGGFVGSPRDFLGL